MVEDHTIFMRQACQLAKRNLGQTWPNPAVGAVVVRGGKIIGSGSTARGGRPHAEPLAIQEAGGGAKGATLYVTLEPCAHQGQTPPCTDAIIKGGIARVVVACRDPNPQVNGKGIGQLTGAGVEVIEGVCESEARDINCGFFSVVEKGRPYVALKIATSADGKISGGKNRWITSEPAREAGQQLRAQYDAILTGIGTVLADDPLLNVRLSGLEDRSPVRVVLDRQHRLPDDSQIAKTMSSLPTWVLDLPDVASVLKYLTEKGITRLLVEAGQAVNTAFLESGTVDKVYWFKAPEAIGGGGLPVVKGDLEKMLASWQLREHSDIAPDTLDVFAHV